MATNTVTTYWKYHQLNNYVAKAFVLLLMQPGFVFDRDDSIEYSAISASEVTSGNGYTKGAGIVITVKDVVIDNTNHRGKIRFNSVSFTPSGGDISLGGAIIWDLSDDVVVGYMDAEGTITILEDQPYVFQNLEIRNN
jgi:hypothetical protein